MTFSAYSIFNLYLFHYTIYCLWVFFFFKLNWFAYRGQADMDFRVEVEAIGHVRHKNLVRLLGYCIEGTHRYFILLCSLFYWGT